MFQNETQQTIFNPASNPSAAGHQGALRVQHRRLSNGSNHSSDNEPTEKEDDKTFAMYFERYLFFFHHLFYFFQLSLEM